VNVNWERRVGGSEWTQNNWKGELTKRLPAIQFCVGAKTLVRWQKDP